MQYQRADEVAEEMEQALGIDIDQRCQGQCQIRDQHRSVDRRDHQRIKPPTGDPNATLQAMVFDSHYDEFRGAITYVRVMNGTVKKGDKVQFVRAGSEYEVVELGQFTPKQTPRDELTVGQVGYLVCNIKSLEEVNIGDTVSVAGKDHAAALPGYQEPKRMVYCGLYPSDGQDFSELRDALNKLAINDPSFEFSPESSEALGFGFPLRFPGHAAHGSRATAAGAGIGC